MIPFFLYVPAFDNSPPMHLSNHVRARAVLVRCLGAARSYGCGAIRVLVGTHARVIRTLKYVALPGALVDPTTLAVDRGSMIAAAPSAPGERATAASVAAVTPLTPGERAAAVAPRSMPELALPTTPASVPSNASITVLHDKSKRPGTASYSSYARYKPAKTKAEYFALGGSSADFPWDLARGYITVHGADEPPPGLALGASHRDARVFVAAASRVAMYLTALSEVLPHRLAVPSRTSALSASIATLSPLGAYADSRFALIATDVPEHGHAPGAHTADVDDLGGDDPVAALHDSPAPSAPPINVCDPILISAALRRPDAAEWVAAIDDEDRQDPALFTDGKPALERMPRSSVPEGALIRRLMMLLATKPRSGKKKSGWRLEARVQRSTRAVFVVADVPRVYGAAVLRDGTDVRLVACIVRRRCCAPPLIVAQGLLCLLPARLRRLPPLQAQRHPPVRPAWLCFPRAK